MNRRTGHGEDRRQFLIRAAAGFAALPFLMNCRREGALAQKTETDILSLIRKNASPRGAEGRGAIDVPDSVSWKTVLGRVKDEGEPMIISGTVFGRDGKRAAPGVLIYLYHTDMYGIYGRDGEHKHGRFRGWMLTDRQGRYEFRSIRPASYPNTTISAHVHMTLTGTNFREDSVDSILFEGDRFITARERSEAGRKGGFNPILKLEKGADGVLRGVRDIQLWS
jgi:protocatechuate 3,4-dioxygenase beta subunit